MTQGRKPKLRAVCEGPLHWTMGGEYLLLALRLAVDAENDVVLDFVGDGPDRERLVFAVDDLGLATRVRFRVEGSGFGDAHALVLPALVDDAGSAVVERARKAGLSVVCSDLPGLGERADSEDRVFRVPRRDPVALARCLGELTPHLTGSPSRVSPSADR